VDSTDPRAGWSLAARAGETLEGRWKGRYLRLYGGSWSIPL
jgi:hypothetical protein